MEQISSNKQISLHLQKCSGGCPNASICYHLNKNTRDNYKHIDTDFIKLLLNKYTVYDSVCDITLRHINLLNEYKNYNITISCNNYVLLHNTDKDNQIQLSIYNYTQAEAYSYIQKLFLIKDESTLKLARKFLNNINIGKIHLILEQKFLADNINLLNEIIKSFQTRLNKLASLDTCLTSFVVNGQCPYEKDYLDISYDGGLRKCPYEITCNYMEDSNTTTLLHDAKATTKQCIYKEIFKGIN